MERRHDHRFQNTVDAVQPGLVAQGFSVADRGQLDAVTRVDFQRSTRGSADQLPRGQYLVLYHLGDHSIMGARLSRYRLPEAAGDGHGESAVWPYEPRSLTTPTGQPLTHELRTWVSRALSPDPG
jgi:hypothetical protein